MDLYRYLVILWRRKWVILLTTGVTLAVTIVGTWMMIPPYVATTRLRVATMLGEGVDYVVYQQSERLLATYIEIAASRPVMEEVARRMDVDELPEIGVSIIPETELIEITVEDSDPLRAQQVANTLSEVLVAHNQQAYVGGTKTMLQIMADQVEQLEQELAESRRTQRRLLLDATADPEAVVAVSEVVSLKEQVYRSLLNQYEETKLEHTMRTNALSIVEPAVIPDKPDKPNKLINIALGAMVGLGGGVGLAFVLESLDGTLYDSEQIAGATSLPLLGFISSARKRSGSFFRGDSTQAQQLRRLCVALTAAHYGANPRVILIASAEPREGRTTVAASLSTALAEIGHETVVVDADLRHPALHQVLDVEQQDGLSDLLVSTSSLDEVLKTTSVPGLSVITSGILDVDPAKMLNSAELSFLLATLSTRFELVVLDAPALLTIADATILASRVEGVLLVVTRGRSQRDAVREASEQLMQMGMNPLGVVVNRASGPRRHDRRSPSGRNQRAKAVVGKQTEIQEVLSTTLQHTYLTKSQR